MNSFGDYREKLCEITDDRPELVTEALMLAEAFGAAARYIHDLEYRLARERNAREWYEARFHEHCESIGRSSRNMVAMAFAVLGQRAAHDKDASDAPA